MAAKVKAVAMTCLAEMCDDRIETTSVKPCRMGEEHGRGR